MCSSSFRRNIYLGPVDGIGEVPIGRGKQVATLGYFSAGLLLEREEEEMVYFHIFGQMTRTNTRERQDTHTWQMVKRKCRLFDIKTYFSGGISFGQALLTITKEERVLNEAE